MCENCYRYNEEDEEWVPVGCECACAGGDLSPDTTMEGSVNGTQCVTCGHKVG